MTEWFVSFQIEKFPLKNLLGVSEHVQLCSLLNPL